MKNKTIMIYKSQHSLCLDRFLLLLPSLSLSTLLLFLSPQPVVVHVVLLVPPPSSLLPPSPLPGTWAGWLESPGSSCHHPTLPDYLPWLCCGLDWYCWVHGWMCLLSSWSCPVLLTSVLWTMLWPQLALKITIWLWFHLLPYLGQFSYIEVCRSLLVQLPFLHIPCLCFPPPLSCDLGNSDLRDDVVVWV